MKTTIFLIAMALSACAIDPIAANDYSGLGTSELAKTLRYSIFLGQDTVNKSVTRLVNTPQVLGQQDLRVSLQEIGFNCKPAPEMLCTYDGIAQSEIKSPGKSKIDRFVTVIHIDAILEPRSVKISSVINRKVF